MMRNVGWNSDPVLQHMQSSRDFRTEQRENDAARDLAASKGHVFPMADDLLRGGPFFGAELGLDMAHFLVLLRRDLVANGHSDNCPNLLPALDRARETTDVEDVRVVERILADLSDGEAGAYREERLRCRIYLGALGDSDAALELAMDALVTAYRQEWHMVGDGSLPVWSSLGWLAQAAASRSRENLACGTAIAPKSPPENRVLSISDDLRTRVERCLLELHAVGE